MSVGSPVNLPPTNAARPYQEGNESKEAAPILTVLLNVRSK